MVSLSIRHGRIPPPRTECVVWLLPEGRMFARQLARLRRHFPDCARAFSASPFRGGFQETLCLFPGSGGVKRLIVAGLGDPAKLDAERLRRVATAVVRAAEAQQSSSLTFLEDPDSPPEERDVQALLEGAVLAAYRYDRYRTRKDEKKPSLNRVVWFTTRRARLPLLRKTAKFVHAACSGTWLARDLSNAPGNEIYPATLARRARLAGRTSGFRVRVLGVGALRRLRMNGLLAVSAGSARPPCLIVMEYRPRRANRRPVVLVGKGVTFDAGGISIKPARDMAEMKIDMAGAAAVIGTMQAAASLRLPVHLIGLVPATENLPGGSALKPGDIITHAGGLTSEVDNTDAEGRLILADALTYAARYRPEAIIDLATLTGAVVVALGHVATGMMGTDPAVMDGLRRAGDRTGERVWELPLFDDYERLIRSDVADIRNVGGRWAGAITAAMFLKQFAGSHRWVHLDIAGTAIMEESFEYIPKGGSGVGVRLLLDYLRALPRPAR